MAGGEQAGGKINLSEALRQRTQRTTLAALEKRGFKKVNVLNMRTIEKIVGEAVEKSLDRRQESLNDDERAELEKDAREEFLKLLKEHKKVVAEKNKSDERSSELEVQLGALRAELAAQQKNLASERARNIGAENWTLSPGSFDKLENNIRGLFGQLMNEERRLALAQVGPAALRGLSELERKLLAMVDRILSEERERFLSTVQSEHDKKVELLERRVAKLSQTLSETEDALRVVVKSKGVDHGIASIYKVVQGLNLEDVYYGEKKELLKEVFVQNLVLQGKKVSDDDKEGVSADVLEHMAREKSELEQLRAAEAEAPLEEPAPAPEDVQPSWDLSRSGERRAYTLPTEASGSSSGTRKFWETDEPTPAATPRAEPPRAAPAAASAPFWESVTSASSAPAAPAAPTAVRRPTIDLPEPVEPLITETGF